jgi:hypothetical protein
MFCSWTVVKHAEFHISCIATAVCIDFCRIRHRDRHTQDGIGPALQKGVQATGSLIRLSSLVRAWSMVWPVSCASFHSSVSS